MSAPTLGIQDWNAARTAANKPQHGQFGRDTDGYDGGRLPKRGGAPLRPVALWLFIADIGQDLAQFGDQRIVVGQDELQAADCVAQQRAGVAVAS